MLRYTYIDTPIGSILIAGDSSSIIETYFAGAKPKPDWIRDDEAFPEAATQLRAYFAGKLQAFDLPLAPGGTEFQQAVWSALQRIPYGETTTYSTIAERIGRPAAVRAVGAANGANSSRDRSERIADRFRRRARCEAATSRAGGAGGRADAVLNHRSA